jgi:hypothetical protein
VKDVRKSDREERWGKKDVSLAGEHETTGPFARSHFTTQNQHHEIFSQRFGSALSQNEM